MEENGSTEGRSLEQLLLAGLGWLSLTASAADEIADDLAHRVGVCLLYTSDAADE